MVVGWNDDQTIIFGVCMSAFLKKVYTYEIVREKQARGDGEQVGLHRAYAMRAYLPYLLGTVIFMDKNITYMDVVYLRYFKDFEWIHEYNWGRLSGLLVLEVIKGLYMEDETGHRKHHITNDTIFLVF